MIRKSYPTDLTDAQWQAIFMTQKQVFLQQKKAFETCPSLKGFCADAGYRNTFEREVSEHLGLTVEISKKIQDISWHILPKRWIVERTFAWLGQSRRLAKDFEQTNLSAENFVKLGYISQILKFIKQLFVNTGSQFYIPINCCFD